jgi:hypothetical protein
MVNERIASYMPGGNVTQQIADAIDSVIYSDPRIRELMTMHQIQLSRLMMDQQSGLLRLTLDIKREMDEAARLRPEV